MPSRRAFSEAQAERKKGCPAKTSVGSVIAAEIQWNRSRVASSAPDQTAKDRIMTFIIAKAATPSRISNSRPARSVAVVDRRPGSSSCAGNPAPFSASINVSAVTEGAAATETRFCVRLTRADFTPGMAFSVRSTSEMHTAQCAVGSDRMMPASRSARFAAMDSAEGAATQAGQAEIFVAEVDISLSRKDRASGGTVCRHPKTPQAGSSTCPAPGARRRHSHRSHS